MTTGVVFRSGFGPGLRIFEGFEPFGNHLDWLNDEFVDSS